MFRNTNRGFTLIELIVVIAILALLAGIAVPAYSGYISKTNDAISMQHAADAYKQYMLETLISGPQSDFFVYQDAPDRILGIADRQVQSSVYPDIRSAVASLTDDPHTSEDESAGYGILCTSISNLYVVTDGESSWSDGSVVFVGDSITAGVGTTKTYHAYLKEAEAFQAVTSMGVAGSCISSKSDYGSGNSPLINRYTTIPSADLIVVFMGTNDYGHETPLGTPSDTTDISFYGALDVIISGIQTQHPDSQLVFITPLHRYGFGTSKILGTKFTYDNIPNGRGHTLSDYVEAIKSVCAKYSVPIIDLFHQCPIDPSKSSDKTTYFPDGLHPNAAGHEIIADLISQSLGYIPNPSHKDSGNGDHTDDESQQEPQVSLLQLGNKFVSSYASDPARASSAENLYLEKGQTVAFKDAGTYQWALAKTGSASSTVNLGYTPDPGWSSKTACVISESGYYGLVLLKCDGSEFDFGTLDSRDVYDYISVE